eukprot:764201-Hanusia_phi.AAC.4
MQSQGSSVPADDNDTNSVTSGRLRIAEALQQPSRGRKRGRGGAQVSYRRQRRRVDGDDLPEGPSPVGCERGQQPEEEEREILPSKICSIDPLTSQYVCNDNNLPEGCTEEQVAACFAEVPIFQWDRLDFLSMIEDIARIHSSEFGSCMWGNKYADDFTVPRHAVRDGRAEHAVHRPDGGGGPAPGAAGRGPAGAQHQLRRQEPLPDQLRGADPDDAHEVQRGQQQQQGRVGAHAGEPLGDRHPPPPAAPEDAGWADGRHREVDAGGGRAAGRLHGPPAVPLPPAQHLQLHDGGGQLHGERGVVCDQQGHHGRDAGDEARAGAGPGGRREGLRGAERAAAQRGGRGPVQRLHPVAQVGGPRDAPVRPGRPGWHGQVHASREHALRAGREDHALLDDGALVPLRDGVPLGRAEPVRGGPERRAHHQGGVPQGGDGLRPQGRDGLRQRHGGQDEPVQEGDQGEAGEDRRGAQAPLPRHVHGEGAEWVLQRRGLRPAAARLLLLQPQPARGLEQGGPVRLGRDPQLRVRDLLPCAVRPEDAAFAGLRGGDRVDGVLGGGPAADAVPRGRVREPADQQRRGAPGQRRLGGQAGLPAGDGQARGHQPDVLGDARLRAEEQGVQLGGLHGEPDRPPGQRPGQGVRVPGAAGHLPGQQGAGRGGGAPARGVRPAVGDAVDPGRAAGVHLGDGAGGVPGDDEPAEPGVPAQELQPEPVLDPPHQRPELHAGQGAGLGDDDHAGGRGLPERAGLAREEQDQAPGHRDEQEGRRRVQLHAELLRAGAQGALRPDGDPLGARDGERGQLHRWQAEADGPDPGAEERRQGGPGGHRPAQRVRHAGLLQRGLPQDHPQHRAGQELPARGVLEEVRRRQGGGELQQEADADGGGQDHADGDQQPGQRDGRRLLPGREDPLLRVGHGGQVHAPEADRGGRGQGGPGQRGHGDDLQHVDAPVPGVRPGPPAGQGQREQQGVGGPQPRPREEQRAAPAGPAPGRLHLPDHEPERPAPVLQRARLHQQSGAPRGQHGPLPPSGALPELRRQRARPLRPQAGGPDALPRRADARAAAGHAEGDARDDDPGPGHARRRGAGPGVLPGAALHGHRDPPAPGLQRGQRHLRHLH